MRRAFSWFLATILVWLLFAPAALAVDPEQNAIPICTVYSLNRGCFRGKTTPDINSRAYVRDGQDGATAGTTCGGLGTTLNLCKFIGTKWIVESVGGAGSGTTLTDSASLSSALSDETGTGAAVFGTGPTITSLPSAVNPGDALGLGDPSLVSAATLLHADGSVALTQSQPFGGFKGTGLGQGTQPASTDTTSETASMIDLRKASVGPPNAGAAPGLLSNQECNSITSCPDAFGEVFIDLMPALAGNLGGRRDTDGSMWGNPTGICSGSGGAACATAADDFIRSTDNTTAFTLNAGISQWGASTVNVFPNSSALDQLFCRDASFVACTTGAGCTSTFGGSGQVGETLIAKHGSRYYPLAIQSYAGCNSSTTPAFDPWMMPSVALTTSDSVQLAWPDGTHQGSYMSGLIAQMTAEAKWESTFRPKVNMLTNGSFEADCSGSNGWHNSGNYSTQTNMSQITAYAPTTPNPATDNAVYGKSCLLSASRSAGDGITSDAVTVDPYRWYQASGYISAIQATTGQGVTIDVLDNTAAPGASITTATGATNDLKVWYYDGGDYVTVSGTPPTTAVTTGSAIQVYGWRFFTVKFYSRANTQVRLQLKTAAGTSKLRFDDWKMNPAIFQNASLNNVFPSSFQKWTLEGDSRSDTSVSASQLPAQLDTVFAAARPGIFLFDTFSNMTTFTNGVKAQTVVADGAPGTLKWRPTYGLYFLGINDISQGRTAAQLEGDWISMRNLIKSKGSIPVHIGEYPYLANSTWNKCAGTSNCGKLLNDAQQLLFTNLDEN